MGVGISKLLEMKEVDREKSRLNSPQVKAQIRKKENQKTVTIKKEVNEDPANRHREE